MAPSKDKNVGIRPANPPEPSCTSTVLINNIHCASCVTTIQDVLSSLNPPPSSVESSIVSHKVLISHSPQLPLRTITGTLHQAGFELHSAFTEDSRGRKVDEAELHGEGGFEGWLESAADRLSRGGYTSPRPAQRPKPHRSFSIELRNWEKRRQHIDNCTACQTERRDRSEKRAQREQHRSAIHRNTRWSFGFDKPIHSRQGSTGELLSPELYSNDARISEASLEYPLTPTTEKPAQTSKGKKQTVSPFYEEDELTKQAEETFSATFSIEGMTCSSCTGSVSSGVKELPFILSIDVNLLTNSASTLYSGPRGRVSEIQDRIESLGFGCTAQDVALAPSQAAGTGARTCGEEEKQSGTTIGTWRAVLAIGGMTCASCTNSVAEALKKPDWARDVNVNLLTNSASLVFDGPRDKAEELCGMVEDCGFEASVQECTLQISQGSTLVGGGENDDHFTAVLAIGGMTCAACTGGVTTGLKELDFVDSVNVNLLTHSATVEFHGSNKADELVSRVEDLGFECTIDRIDKHDTQETTPMQRTTMIEVQGMFCDHCPPKVVAAVKSLGNDSVQIQDVPTFKKPIITVHYTPSLPDFSIRDIAKAVTDANDAFSVSIYHPPSVEDRSRAMQLHERQRILIRLMLCIIVAIPTFLIGVLWMSLVSPTDSIRMFFEQPMWVGRVTRTDWALFFLATPVMFFAADIFHTRALKEIKAIWKPGSKVPLLRRFYRFGSMHLLLSAGTSVAYFSSVALIIVMSREPRDGSHMAASTYFDSVVFLTLFILVGRFLEAYSKAKTGDAVASLGGLRPKETLLVDQRRDIKKSVSNISLTSSSNDSSVSSIDVDLLEVGDIVRIPHGASPPSDGVVTAGDSSFDESSLTGEARLVPKIPGDALFVGTVNHGKPLDMKVTGLSGQSMLDKIVKVVREGQAKRAPVERIADLITGYFVPVITLIAIVDFIIWISLGISGALPARFLNDSPGGWPFWSLQFAIAVFVVACPCGIGLAAPTALFVGSGLAAKHGILVKGGGEAFQEASALDAIVFDKTGTLTEGREPTLVGHELFITRHSAKEKIIWSIVSALEESSTHPIASAITSFAAPHAKIPFSAPPAIEEIPGKGLRGTFHLSHPDTGAAQEYEAQIGSERLMDSLGVTRTIFTAALFTQWQSSGASLALLAIRRVDPSSKKKGTFSLAAAFATATPLRDSAAPTVAALQRMGLDVYIVSGDNAATARAVGNQLGIPSGNVIADVLPTEKAEKIKELQHSSPSSSPTTKSRKRAGRRIVAMVGDGINDAPALSASDVSISIGSGTDVAISASKFVLVSSDLKAILTLVSLSRTVFRRVKVNFAWALVYNLTLVPVAAGVLMGVGERGVRLSPVWASAAMAASSVSVVLSSLALRVGVRGVGWRRPRA